MAGGTGAFQAGEVVPGLLFDILRGASGIAVAGTATVYSKSFFLKRGVTFGWELKFTSSGVVAVTVELEQSNQPPNTEQAQDDSFVIPISKLTTNGLFPTTTIVAAATRYITAYSPVATILGRLKISGTGSNDASTVLSLARLYEIKNV